MYVLIIPTNLVCLLFSTVIPTSLFNLSNYFLYLYYYVVVTERCSRSGVAKDRTDHYMSRRTRRKGICL